jgi:GTPase SAR1 family protein
MVRPSRLRFLVIPRRQSFIDFTRTKLDRRFLCTTSSKAITPTTGTVAAASWSFIFSFLFAGVFAIIQNYGNIKEAITDFEHKFRSTVAQSTYPIIGRVEDTYVERSELEKLITLQMEKTPNGKYCIVYGNETVGKSSLITKCATSENGDKKGYVRVVVGDPMGPSDVVKSLLRSVEKMRSDIETQMRKVHDKYGLYPVIVFEVECDDTKVMNNVRSVAKRLATTCNCIIVISESNSILEFGNDSCREDFIFVDELSIDEATTYLKKQLPEMTAEDMKTQVFDKIGTNPGVLNDLVIMKNKGIPVDQFVEKKLDKARRDLSLFPLQTILKALKNLPDPNLGVNPHNFHQQQNGVNLSNPKEVGVVMKKCQGNNPLLYRMETRRYQLLSTGHRTALQSYDP